MDYFPVRINTLRGESSANFDIYIQVGERFVHYIRESDQMDGDRLKNLKKKGVRKLFIEPSAEGRYLEYLSAGLDTLKSNSQPIEERGEVANDTMVTAAENAERNLETEQGMKMTEDNFGKIIDFLMSDRGAIKSILGSAGTSLDNNQHAATVSSLTLSLATRAGITDSKELLDMGIAALVHDLGKNKMGFDPMKPRDTLTAEEKKKYQAHPMESVNMLSGKAHINPHVLGLISNHEEVGQGRGFPERKNLAKLDKPYQVLNLVNDFDRFCNEGKLEPLKAIDTFFEKRGELFDEELVGILATVLT